MRTFLLIVFLPGILFADLDKSIDAGVKFLLENQRPDGSFGTANRTKGLNIYAPGPGAHDCFKSATSALCLMALAQLEKDSDEIKKAIRKCTSYLLKVQASVRRVDGRWVGNTWSHAYTVKAFLAARKLSYLKEDKTNIDKAIKDQIFQLQIINKR